MTLELINPGDLPTPSTYTQVIVATGSKMVFIAGQEPEDAQGNLAGPRRPRGPGPPGIHQPRPRSGRRRRPPRTSHQDHDLRCPAPAENLPVIEEARIALFGAHKPADTLIGVETPARPGYLIEVDAIAVTDG